jgi:uncharacterized protein YndB with AHSA1/START domain
MSPITGPGDEAVRQATGRGWQEWFAVLDEAGGRTLDHKGIVAYLNQNHTVSAWWQQSIAVAYEQARGTRQKHEMPEGYQVSRSKTVSVPLAVLYQAWSDEAARRSWLPGQGYQVRTENPEKSVRLLWEDGRSKVEIYFYAKEGGKSQATVQHSRLPDREAAERFKGVWGEALERLKSVVDEIK